MDTSAIDEIRVAMARAAMGLNRRASPGGVRISAVNVIGKDTREQAAIFQLHWRAGRQRGCRLLWLPFEVMLSSDPVEAMRSAISAAAGELGVGAPVFRIGRARRTRITRMGGS